MRRYTLLLAATLTIAALTTGCESWDNGKTPDMDATTQETGPTEGTAPDPNGTHSSSTNHNHNGTSESTTGTSESR